MMAGGKRTRASTPGAKASTRSGTHDADVVSKKKSTKKQSTSTSKRAAAPRAEPLPGSDFYAIELLDEQRDGPRFPRGQMLYCRVNSSNKHTDTADDEAADEEEHERRRTLLVCNLPPYVSMAQVRAAFGACGPIASISFGHMPTAEDRRKLKRWRRNQRDQAARTVMPDFDLNRVAGYTTPDGQDTPAPPAAHEEDLEHLTPLQPSISEQAAKLAGFEDADHADETEGIWLPCCGFAHVIYHDESSVHKALALKAVSFDTSAEGLPPPKQGLQKWLDQYERERGDAAALQLKADLFMHEFDKVVVHERKKKEEVLSVPDEDGWVTVGRRGGKKTTDAKGTTVGVATAKLPNTKKERSKADFYRFQLREERRNRLEELRSKFDEDRRRLAKMREGRKFKPY